MEEWVSKLWYIHTTSTVNNECELPEVHATTYMNHKPNDEQQNPYSMYYIFSFR